MLHAQVSKTVIVTPGGLLTALTPAELSTVTNLTLTGSIDYRDFLTMRLNMPLLLELDLSEVKIETYITVEKFPVYYMENTIPDYAFEGKTSLKLITLPASISSIGRYAFSGCNGLTNIVLPPSVKSIWQNAFSNCYGLTNIVLPSSVTYISHYAFSGCTGLTGTLTIPPSVTEIGAGAFEDCSGLTSLSINSSNLSIGSGAFQNCSSISSIYNYMVFLKIHSSVTDVFYNVNKNTTKLYVSYGSSGLYAAANQWNDFTNIIEMPGFRLSETAVYLSSDEGNTATVNISSDITWEAVCDQPWLSVSPVSGIGNNSITFLNEANLSLAARTAKVTISAEGASSRAITIFQEGFPKIINVTAGSLFSNLTSAELSTISVLIITGTIDARDFKTMRDKMPLLTVIDLRGATIVAYTGTEGPNNWPSVTSVEYPANEIPDRAFYNGKTGLKSFYFPLLVTSIGDFAFSECRRLTGNLTIPSTVTKIGEFAFGDCKELSSVNIPSSVTSIEPRAFDQCIGLSSIFAFSSVPVDLISSDSFFLRVFASVNKTTCTLNVPVGSKGLYAVASQWKDFTNIVEMPSDIIKPIVTDFTIASTSSSLTVQVIRSNATDNVGITGFKLTETSTAPLAADTGWTALTPVSYTFANEGTKTLYAWAKDAAGNVSDSKSRTVIITLPDLSPFYSEYLFEESAGTTVIDSKGLNNGTIINNAARVNGARGGGVEFTGAEYITLGQSFGENVKNEVTLSAWLKPATSGNYQGIIMHGGLNFDTYALYIRPDSKEVAFKTSGTSNDWISIKNVANLWDGDWHHLAVTYNGSQKVIYLDSVAIITVDATGTIEPGAGYNLLIGAGRDTESPTLLYIGLIDEVRIYNYALTGSQIADLYHLIDTKPPAILLSLSKTSLEFTSSSASGIVNVTSNVSWTVSDDADWLTVSPASGSNNRTVTVTATGANTLTTPRIGTVTVTGSGIIRTVTVTQEPCTPPSAPTIGVITQPTCSTATGSVVLNDLPATGTWTLTRTPGGITTTGTGTSKTITGLTNGTYTYTVTNETGCISGASGNIVINTPVIPAKPVITANDTLLFSDAVTGNQWYNSGGKIIGATSQTYKPTTSDNYYVIVSVSDCSSPISDIISFKLTGVEIVENMETIKVYPNPTNGHLAIDGLPEGEITEIALYNINSKLVKKQIESSSLIQMDLSDLVSGVYLLVFNNRFNNAVKIIKR